MDVGDLTLDQVRERLKHAEAALAGDNEGIRLWMLDCGELVARHRARADEAAATVRSRLWVAIRHGIPLDKPWRGEALDMLYPIFTEAPDTASGARGLQDQRHPPR